MFFTLTLAVIWKVDRLRVAESKVRQVSLSWLSLCRRRALSYLPGIFLSDSLGRYFRLRGYGYRWDGDAYEAYDVSVIIRGFEARFQLFCRRRRELNMIPSRELPIFQDLTARSWILPQKIS